jgi:chemotaxis protein methyltransferase CheR
MPRMDAEMTVRDSELFDIELKLLMQAIFLRYQHDFRDYSVASMRRRVIQAMDRFGCESMAMLQHRILHDPAVFAQMLQYLTVQVSEMFRDPEYFKTLRERVMPVLKTYASVKIWVAGCSSGEEVWSLAILLEEEGLLDRAVIYATDINPDALSFAQAGIYPVERLAGFATNYRRAGGAKSLSDYYTANFDDAIFDRKLRQHIVFSDHSLATDSVFSEVHFVSCRNVLIYFNRRLQDRAVGLFHDALVRRGFLGLGTKESLRFSEQANYFSEISSTEKIYQRC